MLTARQQCLLIREQSTPLAATAAASGWSDPQYVGARCHNDTIKNNSTMAI
jgi:hypothetical protein